MDSGSLLDRSWILGLALLCAGGCGPSASQSDGGQSDGGQSDGGLDARVELDAGALADAADARSSRCVQASLQPMTIDNADDVSVRYRARIQPEIGGRAFDLYLEMNRYGDATYVGTFPLGTGPDASYGSCAHCVMALYGTTLEHAYFADAGSITFERDPFERHLSLSMEGVRLIEVTFEGDDLHTVPVPGGGCIELADYSIDRSFPPPEWECDPEAYGDGERCDCRCGPLDEDCLDPSLPVARCMPAQDCIGGFTGGWFAEGICVDRCDRDAGTACPRGGVCVDDFSGDLCEPDATRIDRTTPLGGTCAEGAAHCGIDTMGFSRGYCDVFDRNDRRCRPVCSVDADCDAATSERCFTLGFHQGTDDAFGLCTPRFPATWTCEGARYEDGTTCDCDCGAPDPDCLDTTLAERGCEVGERCVFDGACATIPANDTCETAVPLAIGTTTGTTRGARNDYTHVRDGGGCIEVEEDAPDVVYAVTLAAGATLDVSARADFDVSLALHGPDTGEGPSAICTRTSTRCVAGAEVTGSGETETLRYTASTAGTYYLVLDAFFSEMLGSFTITRRE
jgi:hypothetical protein